MKPFVITAARVELEMYLDQHSYRHLSDLDAIILLCRLANVYHPAVKLPSSSIPEIIYANPREEFLRRLTAFNN